MLHVRLAATLDALLTDPAILSAMEDLSRAGRPAVEAIGAQLAATVPDLADVDRQHVGRRVRDVLAERGWSPRRKARVAAGRLFSWGAVYAPTLVVPRPPLDGAELSVEERLEKVRDIIARAGVQLGTVDEFIAERRAEAAREL